GDIPMNVVYSASDLYSSLAGISLTSLFINNKRAKEINVYIMDNGISPDNKNKLLGLAEQYGRNISFFSLPDTLLNENFNIQRWNISTFGRLFEASALPEDVKKVIHIDCDTVIDGSLEPLWNTDMTGKAVAGVVECLSDRYKNMIGLSSEDHYVNAGNIVINLDFIRKHGYEKKFLAYIREHAAMLTYVDQEVLNAVIPENEKQIVPLRFNSYSIIHYFSYKQLKKVREVNRFCSVCEYEEAVKNPVVIHFTTCFMDGIRPWIEGDEHPLKYKFDHYKSYSPWADMSPWDDNRSKLKKIIKNMLDHTPKPVICVVIGFIHGTVVPFKNQYIRKKKTRKLQWE
ncbi:MAG: glycosyltransferase family 8 protein, partial [Clostridiales bacterium]|nr:glycosyltransferase family 8 protein [Clostridiales bacterium]